MSGPQNVTLDGVVQDPDGAEGFGRGGWFGEHGAGDLGEWAEVALEEALAAGAWLLGRRSYEFFASRWPTRTGPLADRLNELPRYVVSSTLTDPAWAGTRVLRGDVATRVAELKQQVEGDIVVPASHRLGRELLRHDLVDELRVVVFPVVLGAGERLFDGVPTPLPLRLVATRPVGAGLVHLTYEVGRPAGPPAGTGR